MPDRKTECGRKTALRITGCYAACHCVDIDTSGAPHCIILSICLQLRLLQDGATPPVDLSKVPVIWCLLKFTTPTGMASIDWDKFNFSEVSRCQFFHHDEVRGKSIHSHVLVLPFLCADWVCCIGYFILSLRAWQLRSSAVNPVTEWWCACLPSSSLRLFLLWVRLVLSLPYFHRDLNLLYWL